MSYNLSFADSLLYDAGKSGITVPVRLRLSEISVDVDAKLDTGASDCIFSRRFGEDLGFIVEEGEKIQISTATGLFTAYAHEVTLTVLNYELDIFALFAEDSTFNRNVLGRRGFLDQVMLGLIDYEGRLYLSLYGQS